MLKILLKSATTLLLFTALSAKALPIVEADAFTAGDNKAVLETATGLTWLDYGVNGYQNHNTVISELNTTYAGWRLPTQDEVINLWNNMFGDQPNSFGTLQYSYCESSNCYTEQSSLFSMFGKKVYGNTDIAHFVFINDKNTIGQAFFQYTTATDSNPTFFISGVLEEASWFDKENTFGISTMLVKDPATTHVPEPSTLFLFALGLLGLGIKRFRKAA